MSAQVEQQPTAENGYHKLVQMRACLRRMFPTACRS